MSSNTHVPGGDITMNDLATPSTTSSSSSTSSTSSNDIQLDLDNIANRYKLYGRITRLLYISNHSYINRKHALELIIDTLKKDTLNVDLYRSIYSKKESNILDNNYSYDSEWIIQAENKLQQKKHSIEKDISFHTGSQIRENIRVS